MVLSPFVKFTAILHTKHPVTIFNFCVPEDPKFSLFTSHRWQQQSLASLTDKRSFANLNLTQNCPYMLMTHIHES